jgi:DNA-binding NtrC family response regulator
VLRALQEGKITRVGGEKDIDVNVRVIAATNKDLLKEIEQGNFRLDLYHRLNVINIHVPELNNRREDIPLLVNHFLHQVCEEYKMKELQIEPKALEKLTKHNWTGNIRELRNIIERLIILSENIIKESDIEKFVIPK